jgi:hypothetical protein
MNRSLWLVAALTVTSLTAGGCGRAGSGRTNLAGKATLAGKPIPFGIVEFVPDDKKGHKGPVGSAEIVNGEYSTLQGDTGVLPGPHLVRVTGYEERPITSTNENEPSKSKPLFVEYVTNADLAGPAYDIEVPDNAKGVDFSLSNGKNSKRPSNDP